MKRNLPAHLVIDSALDARLLNWGRCQRDRPEQGISATGKFCDALRKSRTGSVYDEPQSSAIVALDPDDAEFVEAAWRSASMPTLDRTMLRYAYVLNYPYKATCRVMGIRWDDYDWRLKQSADSIGQVLARMEYRRIELGRQDHGVCDYD